MKHLGLKTAIFVNILQEDGDGGKKRDGMTYKIEDVPPWYVGLRNLVFRKTTFSLRYMCAFLGFQHFLTMIGASHNQDNVSWMNTIIVKRCL